MKLLLKFEFLVQFLALLSVTHAIDCGKESSEEEDDQQFEQIAHKNERLWEKVNHDQSKKHGITFRPKSKDDRKAMFKQKAMEAKEANKKSPKFCRKANEMDALDDDELQAEFLGLDMNEALEEQRNWPQPKTHHGFSIDKELERLPASLDHSDATGPVENQAGCGSCWAFAASHTLTGVIAASGGKVTDYSEQQIADCTYPRSGCDGGLPSVAWLYLMGKGAMLEKDYPYIYKSESKNCKDHEAKGKPIVTGVVFLPNKNEPEMRKAVAKHPIAISMHVGKGGFYQYKSGVYDYEGQCGSYANHAMTLVGYGTENGDDYWLVKNSWGSYWGDNGYIKVKRGKNQCLIELDANYPVVEGSEEKAVWKKYKNYEYTTSNVMKSYEIAKEHCAAVGGQLPIITSEAQQATIQDLRREIDHYSVWLGGRKQEGKWTWSDGSTVKYTNWGSGEPKKTDYWGTEQDCVSVGYKNMWYARPCQRMFKYVCGLCQRSESENNNNCSTNDNNKEKQRVEEVQKRGIHQSKVISNDLCSSSAQLCLQRSSSAQHFKQRTTGSFQRELKQSSQNRWSVWLGLNDIEEEGQWQWTDGTEASYTDWAVNEPRTGKGRDCTVSGGWQWYARSCNQKLPFICVLGL